MSFRSKNMMNILTELADSEGNLPAVSNLRAIESVGWA